MMRASGVVGAVAWVVVLGACGGGESGGGDTVCNPSGSATMTLTASGVTPKAVCVLPGGTVTFRNNDTVAHDIAGDGACSALALTAIAPSTSRSTTFPTEQSCPFHEAASPTNEAFKGTVFVTPLPQSGPGH